MLSAVTLPLAITLLAWNQAEPFLVETEDGYRVTGRVSAKLYQSELTRDAIRKTPAWDQERIDSPPVSPRKAIRLADKVWKSVMKADKRKWEVANMHLLFEESHCAWYVTFRTMPLEPEAGLISSYDTITLFVLMDGTVIQPTVEDIK